MTSTRRAAVLAATIAALALAGCSDETDEKNEYVSQVNEATSDLNNGITDISTEATAITSPRRASEVFRRFAGSVQDAAADVSEINPPEEVADLHAQLVEQIRAVAAAATNASDEIESGGPAAAPGAADQLVRGITRLADEVDSTLSEINSELQG